VTARIAGFVTRADAELVAPRSVSRNITPERGGVAPHYGGGRQPAAEPGSDHALCVSTWRNWQRYHMNTHGWVDIAYTGGFCNHGYAFAGRGAGVRTAANGTNVGNQNFYAITWIGGEGQTPSQEAIDAADWWIQELRRAGRAGVQVKPHRYFKPTGCPGDPLVGYAASRDGKVDLGTPAPAPAPSAPAPRPNAVVPVPRFPLPSGWYFGHWNGPRESVSGFTVRRGRIVNNPGHAGLRQWQQRMKNRGWKISVDGLYGNETERIIRLFQAEKKLTVDGKIGPKTWRAAWVSPVT
jgi:hypothetical protein